MDVQRQVQLGYVEQLADRASALRALQHLGERVPRRLPAIQRTADGYDANR